VTDDQQAPALAAVLFDMDGLLVSTEETWFAVETEIMAELGAPWGPQDQAALVGGPMDRSVEYMLHTAGRTDVTAEDLAAQMLVRMERRLRTGPVQWMPGAPELLDAVRAAGIPTGLVTSSQRPIMDAVLDAVGRERFTVTVCADDVARTKPHPDPYQAACARLDVVPASTVALEDSPTGSTSAAAAGCVTVAVPVVAPVDAALVDAVVGSLTELDVPVLQRLVAQRAAA
jgi:HAD superfamily hydrolase (TIGR01509 family)